MDIAIVGGGVFGVMTAIRLAELGQSVTVFERLPGLMQGASTNANRLHSGFHYPRDEETARQCLRGSHAFRRDFGEALIAGVGNAYFIARDGSLTSPAEYLAHCDRLGLRYRLADPDGWEPVVKGVTLGMATDEAVYDPAVLRRLMLARLECSGARIRVGRDVTDVRRTATGGLEIVVDGERPAGFDALVNCAYAEINRLTARLRHPVETRQYEYVAVPLVELDWPRPASISVLDGPFMSLLPFDGKRRHLLYHVGHSVIARHDGPLLDRRWLDPHTSPFASIDQAAWFRRHLESCRHFVPALGTARLAGIVQGPRMVLAHREDTDARPSVVTSPEPGYVTVFSGKVDHCTWVVDEVVRHLSLGDGVVRAAGLV